MGGWAARKALRVVEHVEQGEAFPLLHPPPLLDHGLVERTCCVFSVLAIELLAGCQGIEFLRPLRTTTPLEKVYELVRSVVRQVKQMQSTHTTFRPAVVLFGVVNVYPLLHFLLCQTLNFPRPWIKDRFMSPDIEAVHRLLIEQKVDAAFDAENGGWCEFIGFFSSSGVGCGQTLYR